MVFNINKYYSNEALYIMVNITSGAMEEEKRRREEAEQVASANSATTARANSSQNEMRSMLRTLQEAETDMGLRTWETEIRRDNNVEDKKVYLTGIAEEETGGDGKGAAVGVVPFDVQPVISESGSALYTEVNDIRQAGSIMIYMGSPGREFSINATFVSRSIEEAEKNRKYVQMLRSWRLPEKSSAGDFAVKSPSRLRLTGLGKWLGSTTSLINGIPVRMMSLNIEMPDDTDYLMTESTNFIPIVWKVSMNLKETRSIDELKKFTITEFRTGNFSGW